MRRECLPVHQQLLSFFENHEVNLSEYKGKQVKLGYSVEMEYHEAYEMEVESNDLGQSQTVIKLQSGIVPLKCLMVLIGSLVR